MLNKVIGLVAIIMLLLASCNTGATDSNTGKSEDGTIETTISGLFEAPMDFDGKIVTLEGVITHVCQHGGDKMRIMQDGSDLTVQIMLGDYTGQFNADSEGTKIEITGTVETEVTNIDELSDHQHEDECENTLQAIEAMKELGLDPNIRPFIHLEKYEIK